jgi:mannose-6-phosphate isomerase-like protein (cupin superfamily)
MKGAYMSLSTSSDSESIDVKSLVKGVRDQQFDIVLKSQHSQVVLAALSPGHSSARQPSVNRESDQIVYTIEGEGQVKVGLIDHQLYAGALLLIPAGQPHQVTNIGVTRLLYLDIFAPPAY